jgi:hypothetical protein
MARQRAFRCLFLSPPQIPLATNPQLHPPFILHTSAPPTVRRLLPNRSHRPSQHRRRSLWLDLERIRMANGPWEYRIRERLPSRRISLTSYSERLLSRRKHRNPVRMSSLSQRWLLRPVPLLRSDVWKARAPPLPLMKLISAGEVLVIQRGLRHLLGRRVAGVTSRSPRGFAYAREV